MIIMLFESLLQQLFVDLIEATDLFLLDVDPALQDTFDKFSQDAFAQFIHNIYYIVFLYSYSYQ